MEMNLKLNSTLTECLQARHHDEWQDISFLNSLLQEALQPRFPEAVER